jgi:hypothetical protein
VEQLGNFHANNSFLTGQLNKIPIDAARQVEDDENLPDFPNFNSGEQGGYFHTKNDQTITS